MEELLPATGTSPTHPNAAAINIGSTGPLKTIAAFKAYFSAQGGDPPRVEANERAYDGLRKAGMPEQ